MATSFSTEQYAETLLVALLNFFIGFFGILVNGLAVLTVLRSAHFRNAYGTLSFSHSCLNLAVLLIYFLWVTPTTYVQSSDAHSEFGKIVGQVYILLWTSLVYSHLSLSLNRLVALVFPSHLKSLFSHNICLAFVFFIWLIGFCHVIPLFWYDHCFLTYDPLFWIWDVAATKCGKHFKLFVMQISCFVVLVLILVVNVSVLIYIKMISPYSRGNLEVKLFTETISRSTAFFLILLSSNVLGSLFVERWQRYVFSCLSWQIYHLFDGLLVILLHFHQKLLAEQRELRPVSFVNVEHHGHHSHEFLHHPHQGIHHLVHHNQFSKVDTL